MIVEEIFDIQNFLLFIKAEYYNIFEKYELKNALNNMNFEEGITLVLCFKDINFLP